MAFKKVTERMKFKLRTYSEFRYACGRYFQWLKTECKIRISHPNLGFDTHVRFVISDPASLTVGKDVWIDPFSEILVLHRCPESPVPGSLDIGERVWIGSHANIRAAGGSIIIGPDCLLAQNVSIIASNHAARSEDLFIDQAWRTDKTGVILGSGVWIGAGVIILPGVSIGDNAVIAAGSMVTTHVAAGEVWAGVPARKMNAVG